MMKYKSGQDFRRALEERLRRMSHNSGTPIVRLRKAIAFERFLARLVKAQPQDWVLKGGFMIQLRLGGQSRVTRDIDLLFRQALDADEIHQHLVEAASLDLGDWFEFNVAYPSQHGEHLRFEVECFLGGRRFEIFPLDVGTGDLLVGAVEHLAAPPLLDFADIESVRIPSYYCFPTDCRESSCAYPSLCDGRKQSGEGCGGHPSFGRSESSAERRPVSGAGGHI